jgi:hypothetical protein
MRNTHGNKQNQRHIKALLIKCCLFCYHTTVEILRKFEFLVTR